MQTGPITKNPFNNMVILAALGYFVDIYDLTLFGIVRKPSLEALGITDDQMLEVGAALMNWQMGGMLLGGLLWGILADKKGRLSVLFGSIIMYSLANIANGFVTTVPMYSFLRFIAGIGLAGELGAGITLVTETMDKKNRGYGTMIVAGIGLFGAVAGNLVAGIFDWRISYFVGGGMGICLLLLRFGVYESGMFASIQSKSVNKGNFLQLFRSWKSTLKYFSVIMIAVPVWFVVGILMYFSPELGKTMGLPGIKAGDAIMYAYIGIAFGDLASGLVSQLLKSRKKALLIFLLMTVFFTILYYFLAFKSLFAFYTLAVCVGFSTGYWAVFMTSAAELYGTNIRATVTTTAPNFVRGAVVLLNSGFVFFNGVTGNNISSSIILGVITFTLAFLALWRIEETFGKDLDYTE
jgi:MFS family permease